MIKIRVGAWRGLIGQSRLFLLARKQPYQCTTLTVYVDAAAAISIADVSIVPVDSVHTVGFATARRPTP
jgi:hypothetical protein